MAAPRKRELTARRRERAWQGCLRLEAWFKEGLVQSRLGSKKAWRNEPLRHAVLRKPRRRRMIHVPEGGFASVQRFRTGAGWRLHFEWRRVGRADNDSQSVTLGHAVHRVGNRRVGACIGLWRNDRCRDRKGDRKA